MNTLGRQLRRHPALIVAAAITVIAMAQVFAVGRGDPEVIRAILVYVDAPKAVLALLLASLPLLALGLAFFVWMAWIADQATHQHRRFPVVALLASVPALLLSPLLNLGILAGIELFLFGLIVALPWAMRFRRRKTSEGAPAPVQIQAESTQAATAFSRAMIGLALVVNLPLLVGEFLDQPWVASEVVAVRGRSGAWILDVAYVVGNSGRSIVLLWDSPREVWVVPDNEIDFRRPCAMGSRDNPTLFQVYEGFSGSLRPCHDVIAERAEQYHVTLPE